MEPINYVGKWVVVRRLPNRQNNNIGKLQCLFVREQTAKQIYGTEHDREISGCQTHYNIKQIVRVINEGQPIYEILINQRLARNLFKREIQALEEKYIKIIKDIGEGNE